MKSYAPICLLLLLFLVPWNPVTGLCHLDSYSEAECDVLEDARYINTYHLHSLRTRSNLTILSPGNFGNLTSLRHLDLTGGQIESIESGSFVKLKSLQTLNLGKNRLSHLEPDSFDGLKHLHSLRLQNNDITQLPSALISLQELRFLDLSGNPLNCNCASLKLKDVLLARGVKISKKSKCFLPSSAKFKPILKQNTKKRCDYEDVLEMLSDQPVEDNTEASGDIEENETHEELEKYLDEDEKELESSASTSASYEKETAAPSAASDKSLLSVETTSMGTTKAVTIKDDDTIEDVQKSSKNETATNPVAVTTTTEEYKPEEEAEISEEIILPIDISKEQNTTDEFIQISSSPRPHTDDSIIPIEGSGESDDDGSGDDGSGMIARMPKIDFSSINADTVEEGEAQISSTSAPTTNGNSNWWGFGDIISSLNPFASLDTTTTRTTTTNTTTTGTTRTTTTERSPEEDLKEEQFIKVPLSVDAAQKPILLKNALPGDDEEISRSYKEENEILRSQINDYDDSSLDPAQSQKSKKGMGSYVVLAALLAILVILIAFAAYKGDFCRKKRKRRDAERGTEMKDMQNSLLDQNTVQPKVQVGNGHTLENVPLMNSSPPDEPKENQKSYDVNPGTISNGSSKQNGTPTDDPVKPPRKPFNQEIEAPLNGLDPPMDDIDAPLNSSLYGGSNEILDSADYSEGPPLTPEAQRVKITMQENPDSVPKTPILITRVKGGENLVKTP